MSGRVMKTFAMESYPLFTQSIDTDVSLQRILACREEKDDGTSALTCMPLKET